MPAHHVQPVHNKPECTLDATEPENILEASFNHDTTTNGWLSTTVLGCWGGAFIKSCCDTGGVSDPSPEKRQELRGSFAAHGNMSHLIG